MKTFVIFCAILLQGWLPAAQYIAMDQTTVIPVSVSSQNHNRIGIIKDRVKKAFFNSGHLTVDVEENSGQLFVQAIKPHCPNTTLSIVTVSGAMQDLELHFIEGPSEVILLQPLLEEPAGSSVNTLCGPPLLDSDLAHLVEGVVNGEVPEGYALFDDPEAPIPLKEGLKMQRLSRLVHETQIVFVYRLENSSKNPKCVVECQVNILDGDWVFLDRYQLKPKECALVLIGCLR